MESRKSALTAAMTKKPKPCHLQGCDKPRYNVLRLCFFHYCERKKLKKAETAAKRLARKHASKGYEKSQTELWWNKCWKLMSEIVRRTGADQDGYNNCYTCPNRKHWKELQGGHRHHRRLDFDFRNIHPQCSTCNGQQRNGGKSGNLGEYEHRLALEYGLEWTAKLKLDANTHPGYRLDELKRIHAELQEKLSKLP